MTRPLFDPERLLRALVRKHVRFVLIGGLAGAVRGSPAATNDADICPDRREDNLRRLAAALRALDARVRADEPPEGLPFDCSAQLLASVELLNLVTKVGDLDVAFGPSGTGGYDDLIARADVVELGGFEVAVASLDDIIRSKRAADRPKDRATLPILLALRDEIGRDVGGR
jgi:hypothetical protein